MMLTPEEWDTIDEQRRRGAAGRTPFWRLLLMPLLVVPFLLFVILTDRTLWLVVIWGGAIATVVWWCSR